MPHPRESEKTEKSNEFPFETQKRVGNGCREAGRYGSKRNEVVKTNVLAPGGVAFPPFCLTAAIPLRGGWADCVLSSTIRRHWFFPLRGLGKNSCKD